jgi:hypothetical protein
MIGLMTLAFLGFSLFVLIAGAFAVAMLVKAVLWLVFLPFRILFGVLLLPILLVKAVVGGLLFLVLAPILLIAALVAVAATIAGLAIPLFPLLCIGFVAWLIMRSNRPAVA